MASAETKEDTGAKPVTGKAGGGGAPKYPTIVRAELAGGFFGKYVTFVIRTPSDEVIHRRYSDFEWLRAWLVWHYPCSFIPPIPAKLPVAMWPTGYLLSRKRELQQFLQRIAIIKYLDAEEVVRYWIKDHSATSGGVDFDSPRKSWDKSRPKPSPKQQFDNLSDKFSTIDKEIFPVDMPEMCKSSRVAATDSIKALESMISSGETFMRHCESVEKSMSEVMSALTALQELERGSVGTKASASRRLASGNTYCTHVRLPMSSHLKSWQSTKKEESLSMRNFVIPVLKRSLFDIKVVDEILRKRDTLVAEHLKAKVAAEKWLTEDAKASLKSSQVAAKHRDILKEEHLKLLSELCCKLALNQMSIVWEANVRRWSRLMTSFKTQTGRNVEKLVASLETLTSLASTTVVAPGKPAPPPPFVDSNSVRMLPSLASDSESKVQTDESTKTRCGSHSLSAVAVRTTVTESDQSGVTAAFGDDESLEAVVDAEEVEDDKVLEDIIKQDAVTDDTHGDEKTVEEPVTEDAVVQEPVAESPVVEEPVAEEPVVATTEESSKAPASAEPKEEATTDATTEEPKQELVDLDL